jgi:hypothetical protein
MLAEPTAEGIAAALRGALSSQTVPEPARAVVSGAKSLQRWADVIELRPELRAADRQREGMEVAVVDPRDASAVRDTSATFVLFLDQNDVPDEELLELLVRAQARTDADVVTCGLRIRADHGVETLHFFPGDAGGLGALENTYGNVALIRQALLLDDVATEWPPEGDPEWPLLARLVSAGAHIVSIPVPLVTRRTRPGSVERNPTDALLVAQQLERALPEPLRTTARLVGGLASPR